MTSPSDTSEPSIPDLTPRLPETIVYVANMSEDVWPFISAISDPTARAHEIEENAALSDHQLFSLSSEDNILFISPKPVNPDFLEYFKRLTTTHHLKVVHTPAHSGLICRDIIKDQNILKEIDVLANSSRRLNLLSYSTSPYFLELAQTLRSRGLTVYTPEAPDEDDAWTVNFYGSKSGIRQLSQQSSAAEPDFKMPFGLVCFGVTDAAKIAAKLYLKEDGVVIKTNKGHSGTGLLIFRPGDLPNDYLTCTQTILKKLETDAYWDHFPIVIEEYVAQSNIGGGFPNVEFKILKTGKVEFLYYCAMRVSHEGVFQGTLIHNSVLSDRLAAQMTDTGFFVGEQLASQGYRGYFDVDFIASRNGDIYVTESNVRRTGGTHVYATALKLFGRDFMYDTFILSRSNFPLPPAHRQSFTQLLQTLNPILYQPKTKEGLIIVSENMIHQGLLEYIIFGQSKTRALELETRLSSLLNS